MTKKADPGKGLAPGKAHAARLKDPVWHPRNAKAKKDGAERRHAVWLGGAA